MNQFNESYKDVTVSEEWKEALQTTLNESIEGFATEVDFSTFTNAAECVNTAIAKIMDGKFVEAEQRYFLYNLFGASLHRLILVEMKYQIQNPNSGTAAANKVNGIEDWDGQTVDFLSEAYELSELFSVKRKLPGLSLTDAWTDAANIAEWLRTNMKSIEQAWAKKTENTAWREVLAKAEIIEVGDGTTEATSIDVARAVQKYFIDKRTTHRVSYTVKTPNGDVVNTVERMLNPADFNIFVNTNQVVDLAFDYNAQWFNYGATVIENLAMKAFDFANYTGFDAVLSEDDGTTVINPAITLDENDVYHLIHKDALELKEVYTHNRVIEGASDYSVSHTRKRFGWVPNKEAPIVIFRKVPVSAPIVKATKETKETKEAK